jgi:hypothetical protein
MFGPIHSIRVTLKMVPVNTSISSPKRMVIRRSNMFRRPSRNRIKLTVTFLRQPGDIKEVTLKKFKQYTTRGVSRWEEQSWGPNDPMTFTHFTFEKLLGFLKSLSANITFECIAFAA